MAATIAPAPRRHQRNPLITLAATARKADLAPRHYPSRPNPHPLAGGVVTGGNNRASSGRERPPTRADPRRPRHPVAPVRLRRYVHDPLSRLPVPRLSDGLARPTDGTVRRESSATHRSTTWTRRPSREPSSSASTSASASAALEDEVSPADGRRTGPHEGKPHSGFRPAANRTAPTTATMPTP